MDSAVTCSTQFLIWKHISYFIFTLPVPYKEGKMDHEQSWPHTVSIPETVISTTLGEMFDCNILRQGNDLHFLCLGQEMKTHAYIIFSMAMQIICVGVFLG